MQLEAGVCVPDTDRSIISSEHRIFFFSLPHILTMNNFRRCLYVVAKDLPVERMRRSVFLPIVFHSEFLPNYHAEMGHFISLNSGPDGLKSHLDSMLFKRFFLLSQLTLSCMRSSNVFVCHGPLEILLEWGRSSSCISCLSSKPKDSATQWINLKLN